MNASSGTVCVSVLNREPMGMKLAQRIIIATAAACFSAQPRADGDEACACRLWGSLVGRFQCSTASRWG